MAPLKTIAADKTTADKPPSPSPSTPPATAAASSSGCANPEAPADGAVVPQTHVTSNMAPLKTIAADKTTADKLSISPIIISSVITIFIAAAIAGAMNASK